VPKPQVDPNLPTSAQLLHRNVQRFRDGLVFKAHRLCASLNSRLESNKEDEEGEGISDEEREVSQPQVDPNLRGE